MHGRVSAAQHPFAVAAARDLQRPAQQAQRIGIALSVNEGVPHSDSPGGSSALLRRRPLRTVLASFPAHGSSHPTARKRTEPTTTEAMDMRPLLKVGAPCRVERVGVTANLRVALDRQGRSAEEIDRVVLSCTGGATGGLRWLGVL